MAAALHMVDPVVISDETDAAGLIEVSSNPRFWCAWKRPTLAEFGS
jgi:hypothetical protein